MVAYLGEPAPLSRIVLDPEHSLLVQSYAPREMLSGVVNADGFGCGWYAPEVDDEPAVYRSDRPIWSDRSFASIAPKVLSPAILAAVRSATPGLPAEESGVPPFASGPHLFAHNGAIKDFRHTAMRPLRDLLSDGSYADLLGTTDSETVFALLLDQLHETRAAAGATDSLGAVTAETVKRVAEVCEKLGVPANLTVGVTDGEALAFVRYATEGPGNSLYVLEDGAAFPGAIVVASERLDDDAAWRPVPDRHLLIADRKRGAALRPL
jgi:glutamine amidotransferase